MPTFEFNASGRTYEIDAPDMQTAITAFQRVTNVPTTGQDVPSYDAMGNPTGMTEAQIVPPQMSYGDQMSNTFQAIDSGVRQVAKGVPFIGSYLDEANAATRSAFGGGSYDQNFAAERARDKQFEANNPSLSTGLQVAGGLASGGALLRAAPGVGNFLLGNGGVGLFARSAASAAAGAGAGAVGGFGAGEGGFDNRLKEAGSQAGVGAFVGGVLPGALTAGQRIASALMNGTRAGIAGRELGVPASAVKRVATSVERDELTPAIAAQRAQEIGPDGMVLDMGRQLTGRAEAVASLPGTGQNRVVDAVEQRVQQMAPRIGQDLDRALGQNPDVERLAQRIEDHFRPIVTPAYEQVMGAHATVWDNNLQRLARRPSIQRAIENAVSLAREQGDDIVNPFVRNADGSFSLRQGVTPNLRFWDYVKKSMDSRISAFQRNPDPDSAGKATAGALMDTRRLLVEHLDNMTRGEYRRARRLAADQITTREALLDGQAFLNDKQLPEQFREMLAEMGPLQRMAYSAGVRRAFQSLAETAPANLSDGGRATYRAVLKGGPNGETAQKLRMLIGDEAENLIRAAQRETGFQDRYARIATNSRTAPRLAAMEDMQPRQAPESFTSAINQAAAAPVKAPLNALFRHGNERTREGVADLLTRQGAERDRALDILLNYNTRRRANTATRDALVSLLLNPTQQQASQTSPPDFVRRAFGGR